MNINATIFIQSINFFIVYLILRYFLFKPVVSVIDSDNAESFALSNIVSQQKKSIEIQEKDRQASWYVCHEYFNANRPNFFMAIHLADNDSLIVHAPLDCVVSDDDIARLKIDVYEKLEEKIKHVH